MLPNENNKRGDKTPPQKSFDFKTYKNNTFQSLYDVEYFLNNLRNLKQFIKIYKLFK